MIHETPYSELPKTVDDLVKFAAEHPLTPGQSLFLLARAMGAFDTLDVAWASLRSASTRHKNVMERAPEDWEREYAAITEAHAATKAGIAAKNKLFEQSGLAALYSAARSLRVGAADELVSVVEKEYLPPIPVSPPSYDIYVRNARKAALDELVYAQESLNIAEEKRHRTRSQIKIVQNNTIPMNAAIEFDELCAEYGVSLK